MQFKKKEDILSETQVLTKKLQELQKLSLYQLEQDRLNEVRKEIANLIESSIAYYAKTDQFDLWEKSFIAHAIGLLANNLLLGNSTLWLKACLTDIQMSTSDLSARTLQTIDKEISKLEVDGFNKMLESLFKIFPLKD